MDAICRKSVAPAGRHKGRARARFHAVVLFCALRRPHRPAEPGFRS